MRSMIKREALEAIYQEGDLLLGEAEGKMYLYRGRDAYWLSDYQIGRAHV